MREARQRTVGMLADQAERHDRKWMRAEREAEERLAAQETAERERETRAEAALAEATEVFADAEASARRLEEEARTHAEELVAAARRRAEEIALETERVLREHSDTWDAVRAHIGQMRNSLTALTGQVAQE